MSSRRVRIVCISDTHNATPHLPPGDILIHAGDLTGRGSASELQRTFHWLDNADFKVKIVIAGNHDRGLDDNFFRREQGGSVKRTQNEKHIHDNVKLFTSSANLHYLQHEAKVIRMPNGDGSSVCFKVFGSPYSWNNRPGAAFSYRPSDAGGVWEGIPLDADIVVTHGPAKGHLDGSSGSSGSEGVGCEGLREALWRVRPRLFVCGHIHEARGCEIVDWDLEEGGEAEYREKNVKQIEDWTGRGNKQWCIDISGKGEMRLENDGAAGGPVQISRRSARNRLQLKWRSKRRDSDSKLTKEEGMLSSAVRSDQQALEGRRGRKQTCLVNASFLASKSGKDGKYVNKPIVIDIDLQVEAGVDEWNAGLKDEPDTEHS